MTEGVEDIAGRKCNGNEADQAPTLAAGEPPRDAHQQAGPQQGLKTQPEQGGKNQPLRADEHTRIRQQQCTHYQQIDGHPSHMSYRMKKSTHDAQLGSL